MSDTAQLALTEHLATSASAGLLREVDGAHYVAAEQVEPNTGERYSFVEFCDSPLHGAEAVGHATVLTSALDLIRGQTFIELLDILVEPARNDRRRRAVELLAAVQKDAAAARKPLLGNVQWGPPAW